MRGGEGETEYSCFCSLPLLLLFLPFCFLSIMEDFAFSALLGILRYCSVHATIQSLFSPCFATILTEKDVCTVIVLDISVSH